MYALHVEWEIESTHVLLQRAEELAALGYDGGSRARAICFRDWCLSDLGQTHEGVRSIGETLSDFRAKGLLRFVPLYLMLLALVLERSGHRALALERFDEALRLVEITREKWCEAELYRRKGELLRLEGVMQLIRSRRACSGAS